MNQLTSLRLYFPLSARAKATRFWHRLSAPTLGHHLLQCARRARIEQAVMHPVQSGYLPGEKMRHHHADATPSRLPQCIELIDTENRLRKFLHDHAEELREVRAVLYRCELPTAA
jgi:PII-like signaling protein